jgi:hypothetical protein
MAEAAQFRAGEFIPTRLSRLEPTRHRSSRHHILFEPKVRNEKAVNDIFRSEMDVDNLINRHMNIVIEFDVILSAELAVGPRVSNAPVKLFSRNLDGEITFSISPRCSRS